MKRFLCALGEPRTAGHCLSPAGKVRAQATVVVRGDTRLPRGLCVGGGQPRARGKGVAALFTRLFVQWKVLVELGYAHDPLLRFPCLDVVGRLPQQVLHVVADASSQKLSDGLFLSPQPEERARGFPALQDERLLLVVHGIADKGLRNLSRRLNVDAAGTVAHDAGHGSATMGEREVNGSWGGGQVWFPVFAIKKGRRFRDAIRLAQSLAEQTIGEDRLPPASIVLEGQRLLAAPFGQLLQPPGELLGRVV